MTVVCVNDNFAEFKRQYGDDYTFPEFGKAYTVRGRNKDGGLLLNEISNPFTLVSISPLLFMELHFHESRFIYLNEDTGRSDSPRFTFEFSEN
jgi:hypothetical protein